MFVFVNNWVVINWISEWVFVSVPTLTSRWRHRQVLGAVLTSSTGSTLRCCRSSRSRSCPSCRLCPMACRASSSKAVRSSWSGPVASSSRWIPGTPEERNCPIISSLCFGRSLWWFRTLLWSLRSSCLAKDSTTQRFCVFFSFGIICRPTWHLCFLLCLCMISCQIMLHERCDSFA